MEGIIKMGKKKNVIFLMSDQMSSHVMDDDYIMPNLYKLKDDGVYSDRCYASNPICSPSRASLMTGMLPHNHGMVDVTHAVPSYRAEYDYNLDTFSNVLHDNGYKTAYYGKWHVERKHNLDYFGYDEFITERNIPSTNLTAVSKTILSNPGSGFNDKVIGGVYAEGKEASEEYYIYSKAIDFIERNKENPFFVFLSTYAPHDPYTVPKEIYDMYEGRDLNLPESFNDTLKDKPNIYKRLQSSISSLTEEDFLEIRRYYHSYCTLVDTQIGRMVEYLKKENLYEDTMIVVLSDHGDYQGAHRLIAKGVPAFEEAYRIPLVWKMPDGVNAGYLNHDHMSITDIGSTVLDLLELPALRNDIDGKARTDSLMGEGKDEAVIAENFGQRFGYAQRVLWKGNLKYVFNTFDYDEFYDLDADPNELHNLIDNPEYEDKVKDLALEMQKIIAETGDMTMNETQYFMHRICPVGPVKSNKATETGLYNKQF